MFTNYIARFDDACLTMDRKKWDRIEKICDKYNIKPIVAIVPHNEDNYLQKESEDPLFWEKVRKWQKKGWHIALHGYNHVYTTSESGFIPFSNQSEFAGLDLQLQEDKIKKGMEIFNKENIKTDIWIAPSHTFDENTLIALKNNTTINIVCDGIAISPFKKYEFNWIPQQIWRFRKMPFGTWTGCFHPNEMNEKNFNELENFIGNNKEYFIDIGDLKYKDSSISNSIFASVYSYLLKLKFRKNKRAFSSVRKKILFNIHTLTTGGAERVTVHLLNNIDRKKFEVHLCVFNNVGELTKDIHKDVIVHDLGGKSVRKGIFKWINLVYKEKPDIVFSGISHLNLMIAVFIPLLNLFRANTIFIARETSIASLHTKKEKYSKVYQYLYKKVYKNYDAIIAQSKYMKNDLVDFYNIDKNTITIINNPVDMKVIQELSNSIEIDIFNNNKINLLSVGNLRWEKGFDLLLRALSLLDDKYILTIVGAGEQENYLQELAKQLKIMDRVFFVGFQQNPYAYMKQADLYILTSHYEGFPNAVLEAHACGLPVVAFKCPGGIEEIIIEGENGWFVENGNVNELASKIEIYSNIHLEKNQIIDTVMKRYEVDYIIEKYEKFFLSQLIIDNNIKYT